MDAPGLALAVVVSLAGGFAVAGLISARRLSVSVAERDAARAERDAAHTERDRLRAERDSASERARAAELERAEADARVRALTEAETQLKDTFARVSNEALQANRQQFLDLADDRFRQAGRPLTDTLDKVEAQLREIEKDRVGAQRALSEQIQYVRTTGEQLRAETAALVSALRKPQARGQWGELQLRRCVEYAGMLDRCDFVEQPSVTTTDGMLRPDMIVNLVGGKTVVVDSKVTLVAYLEAHDAADDTARDDHLGRHARHLREHVDRLAGKQYWSQFSSSPEFVIMFVPGDGPLNAALETDPSLLEYAFGKRVQILGPMSLVPTLRAIAYAWQQQALADNARDVFELGRELYKRLGTMGGHVDKLGRSLTRAVNDYNATVGSLESQVMTTARKLNEMKVTDEPLVELTGLDDTVRPLTKPELVASAEEARAVVQIAPAESALDRIEDFGINVGNDPEGERRTGS
jgi:DNA recombination protein RmuC